MKTVNIKRRGPRFQSSLFLVTSLRRMTLCHVTLYDDKLICSG